MRLERFALLVVALAHLAAQLAHGYSHIATDVPITAAQLAYIIVVVTVLPLAAVAVVFWKHLCSGAWLFAASMAASFVFGYLFHFVLDTADLHSNVIGKHSNLFFHSALSLALIEFAGFVYGLAVALRHGRNRSDRAAGSAASPGKAGGGETS